MARGGEKNEAPEMLPPSSTRDAKREKIRSTTRLSLRLLANATSLLSKKKGEAKSTMAHSVELDKVAHQ